MKISPTLLFMHWFLIWESLTIIFEYISIHSTLIFYRFCGIIDYIGKINKSVFRAYVKFLALIMLLSVDQIPIIQCCFHKHILFSKNWIKSTFDQHALIHIQQSKIFLRKTPIKYYERIFKRRVSRLEKMGNMLVVNSYNFNFNN